MKYDEAVKLKLSKLNLIGTIDNKGFTIGEILIVPSDVCLRDIFFTTYLATKDADKAICPYINDDVEVWAIDIKHLQDANVLFYNKL